MRQLSFPSFVPRGKKRCGPAKAGRGAGHRRRAPRWISWKLKPALLAGSALILLTGATVTWRGGGIEAAGDGILAWTGSAGLAVNDVLVLGRVETPADHVLAALDVGKGTPLLAFSPEAARERLLALGWVRDARVERRLPDIVYVELEERRPAAIWQNEGILNLVDDSGAVIGGDAVTRFKDLRVIVGPDAPGAFDELFTALGTQPEMLEHVAAAIRVGGRRWDLKLDNGMTVLLPEVGIAAAWKVLADTVRDSALLDRNLIHIDLRIPGRLVVRLAPEAAKARRAGQGA